MKEPFWDGMKPFWLILVIALLVSFLIIYLLVIGLRPTTLTNGSTSIGVIYPGEKLDITLVITGECLDTRPRSGCPCKQMCDVGLGCPCPNTVLNIP